MTMSQICVENYLWSNLIKSASSHFINTILGGHTCQNKEQNIAQIGIKRQYVSKLEKIEILDLSYLEKSP